jgi:hypothetical protein
MNHADAAKEVEKRVQDHLWAPSDLALAFDNVAFKPPSPSKPWLRTTILDAEAVKTDLVNRYRHPGLVVVQVFVPIQSGTRGGRALADQVASLFRSVTVSGIFFRTPSLQRVGDTSDGWFQMNVNVPFFWDESF